MPETFHPGRLAKFFINEGSYDTPSWTEVKRVADMNIPQGKNASQVVTRESPNQKNIIGAKTFEISGTYHEKVQDDAVLTLIRDSYFADTAGDGELDLAMMNQDIATVGSLGIRGFFCCTQFDRDEPIGDSVSRSITFVEVDHEENDAVVDVDEYEITA